MFYPQEVLDEVMAASDIVRIISSYTDLKQKGNSYFGLCPFHKETTPSFSVTPAKQLFHCFGCGVSGNVYSFVMQIENYDFVDAIKHLAGLANYTLPEAEYSEEIKKSLKVKETIYELNKIAAKYFYKNLTSEDGQSAAKYLDGRMVLPKIRVKFGLGYSLSKRDDLYRHLLSLGYKEEIILKSGLVIADKKGGYFDRFSARLMIPIFEQSGKVVGFGGRIIDKGEPKYLNSPDTPVFEKSKNLYSINYARLSRSRNFILVEGYMDVISLYQAGIRNVVAALGTASNIEHAKLIKRYADSVTILFDSDEAGEKAALRTIPIFESSGLKVKVLKLPSKDPDDYIKQYGSESFNNLLEKADNSIIFQINCIKGKFDLQNTDSKIEFTTKAAKIISKAGSAIELDGYSQEISKQAGISKEAILSEVAKITGKAIDNSLTSHKKSLSYIEKNKTKDIGVYEAKKTIINMLVNNPRLFKTIKSHLEPKEMGGDIYSQIITIIYDLYGNNRSIEPAELINYFQSVAEQKTVSEIFTLVNLNEISNKELEKDLTALLRTIKLSYISNRLPTVEVAEAKELLKTKENTMNLNITLLDG